MVKISNEAQCILGDLSLRGLWLTIKHGGFACVTLKLEKPMYVIGGYFYAIFEGDLLYFS